MLLGGLLYIVFLLTKGRKLPLLKNIIALVSFIYAGALVSLCFVFVLPVNWHFSNTGYVMSSINTNPLAATLQIYHNCTITGNFHAFFYLVIGNFIMLMPVGILTPLINKKCRWYKVFFLGFGISLFIELSQLLSNLAYGANLRAVEIDDVILNTSGCLIAYFLFALLRKVYNSIKQKKEL